jgi:aspartyl-tRNA(Asn)/glutamyl-tRNA(Gln) amidotransferase subunit C
MVDVNDALLDKLESLTKLDIEPKERAGVKKSLQNILAMMDKLNELDTEGVEPLVYMNEQAFSPREDVVKNQLTVEQVFLNAPKHNAHHFFVPKVL